MKTLKLKYGVGDIFETYLNGKLVKLRVNHIKIKCRGDGDFITYHCKFVGYPRAEWLTIDADDLMTPEEIQAEYEEADRRLGY